jgi:hypothetical protein
MLPALRHPVSAGQQRRLVGTGNPSLQDLDVGNHRIKPEVKDA